MKRSVYPEIIRTTALNILASRPEGVRLADLYKLTEKELETDFEIQEYDMRNALWNIEEKYPQLVTKKKLSPRNAVVQPTAKLIVEISTQEPSDKYYELVDRIEEEERAERRSEGSELNKSRAKHILLQLSDVWSLLDKSDIPELLDEMRKSDYLGLDSYEIENLIGIRHALNKLKDCYAVLERNNR